MSSLKSQANGRIGELITLYDSIISSEQTMMGLRKYNRLPNNHMLGRVMWEGYMHADGYGAAFNNNTMSSVANPDAIKQSNWGIAHEFGHVNQVRPGMKWVGTSECTNNIYSAWAQYCFTPNELRLEHEKVGGIVGGRYNAYFKNGILGKQEWGLQAGPDATYEANEEGEWGGDHFVKLVPMWQLHLYFHICGIGNSWDKPYFWADVFEKVRTTDETSFSEGELQMNFVKNTCDAVQADLSNFFKIVGMLQPVDKYFGDYSSAQKTITQTMIDDVTDYCSRYSKPATPVLQYISGNSIEAFKNKLAVQGTFDQGISGGTSKTISHSTWKNATVFETYTGEQLTEITLVGTGDTSNSSTVVAYPIGATRIEAVAWNGERTLVFGSR